MFNPVASMGCTFLTLPGSLPWDSPEDIDDLSFFGESAARPQELRTIGLASARPGTNVPAVPPAADGLLEVPQGCIDLNLTASGSADATDDILLLEATSDSEVRSPAGSASFIELVRTCGCLWRSQGQGCRPPDSPFTLPFTTPAGFCAGS